MRCWSWVYSSSDHRHFRVGFLCTTGVWGHGRVTVSAGCPQASFPLYYKGFEDRPLALLAPQPAVASSVSDPSRPQVGGLPIGAISGRRTLALVKGAKRRSEPLTAYRRPTPSRLREDADHPRPRTCLRTSALAHVMTQSRCISAQGLDDAVARSSLPLLDQRMTARPQVGGLPIGAISGRRRACQGREAAKRTLDEPIGGRHHRAFGRMTTPQSTCHLQGSRRRGRSSLARTRPAARRRRRRSLEADQARAVRQVRRRAVQRAAVVDRHRARPCR